MSSTVKATIIGILAVSAILWGPFSMGEAISGPNIHKGLWEITAEVEMQGMPMKMEPVTHTQCITQENVIPTDSQLNSSCKIIDSHVAGDTVTWEMACDLPQGKVKMVGEITYAGDTFEGTIQANVQGLEMLQKMSGHRIGECDQ